MKKIFRLGTRGSPLALIQAEMVRASIMKAHPHLQQNGEIEIVPIRTTGDWRPEMEERTFAEMGGNKGLFTKEIEEALLAGYVDAAVHSMKDVTNEMDQLEICAMLERADPRDAFIGHSARTLAELPVGASVGTSSPRRQAQIMAQRPDLKVTPLRGNVETRLKKLSDHVADATILAVSGMTRLSLANRASSIMDTEIMLPAAGQGAVGVAVRRSDVQMKELLMPINHRGTFTCVTAERALLAVLNGNCRTPIAALARLASDNLLVLECLAARLDGTDLVRLRKSGPVSEAEAVGTALGVELKSKLPANFFDY